MATIGKGIAGSAAGSGWIKIADMLPQAGGGGTVDTKVWADAAETILQSARTTSLSVQMTIRASFPDIIVDGQSFELPPAADDGHYEDTFDITLSAAGDVIAQVLTPDNDLGTLDTIAVTLNAPPVITVLSFTAGYPGAQTEVKENDTFDITVTADKSFNAIRIADSGAGDGDGAGGDEIIAVAPGVGPTVVSITIADRGDTPQALAASVRVTDTDTGGLSAARSTNAGAGGVDGTDVVTLNDIYPTVDGSAKGGDTGHSFGVTYPGAQGALKASETATIVGVVTDYDTILYDSPGAELTPANTTTFESPKTVTRLGGTYNVTVDNYRIAATRAANAAVTTVSGVVAIANVAPTVDITLPAARLRSGGENGTSVQDHTVTITANQQLLSAPSIAADAGGSRGTFQGGGFTGGPTAWIRSLRLDETIPDEKGAFTFDTLVATGLAGLVQNTINSGATYTLGGFVQRDLTFAAFATTTSLDTEVVDFTKLDAGIFTATNQPALKQAIGTPPSVTDGYTIDATGANPTSLIWLDSPAASSNSSGTAQITDVEETV